MEISYPEIFILHNIGCITPADRDFQDIPVRILKNLKADVIFCSIGSVSMYEFKTRKHNSEIKSRQKLPETAQTVSKKHFTN